MHWFLKFVLGMKLYMFRTVPLSITRSFSLYTQQWYMSYRFANSLRAGSGWQFHPDLARKLSENLYDIYHCCVYSEKTSGDGQRNCPKHVEFHSKNKFEKSVHLVGFIIRNSFYSEFQWSQFVTRYSTFPASRGLRWYKFSVHRSVDIR
jgi:hypothetical protein